MINKIKSAMSIQQYLLSAVFACGVLIGLYLFVALMSFNPYDNAWSITVPDHIVTNKAGVLGAWSIDVIYSLFGKVGNLVPLSIILLSIYFIRRVRDTGLSMGKFLLNNLGLLLLLAGGAVLATQFLSSSNFYLAGGAVGGEIYTRIYPTLGGLGTTLIAALLCIAGFIFCSGISLVYRIREFGYWILEKNSHQEAENSQLDTLDSKANTANSAYEPELVTPYDFINKKPIGKTLNPIGEKDKTQGGEAKGEETSKNDTELERVDIKSEQDTDNVSISTNNQESIEQASEQENSHIVKSAEDAPTVNDVHIEMGESSVGTPHSSESTTAHDKLAIAAEMGVLLSDVQKVKQDVGIVEKQQLSDTSAHVTNTDKHSSEYVQNIEQNEGEQTETSAIHNQFESVDSYMIQDEYQLPTVKLNTGKQNSQSVESSKTNEFITPEQSILKVEKSGLKTTEQVSTQIATENDNEDSAEQFDELSRQFAEREAERLKMIEEQAQQLNDEDLYSQITNEDSIEEFATKVAQSAPQVSTANKVEREAHHSQPESVIDTTLAKQEPFKKESLIHPLLKANNSVSKIKPTTPLPTSDLLEYRQTAAHAVSQQEINEISQQIEQQLKNFNVKAKVKGALIGPVVTRYELELEPGTKASKVTNLDSDLARALMFRSIRVAESIPGKPYIGIETPNKHRQVVNLRDVIESQEFQNSDAILPMVLGKDISGKTIVVDMAKMPHLLVAGATGSGKSVGVNTMILSLLFKKKPEELRFIMVDPKVVELSIYQDIPHLLTEVVTDMKKASNALRWCVDEMERRYKLLSSVHVRNIEGFNAKIDEAEKMNYPIPNPIWRPGDTMDDMPPPLEKLSYIVVIVDEFADLMMVAGKQVEELIARLAQKARAVGIHLILATQRPSVDVITGLIKANIPSRLAFTVASKTDSRTILDTNGAEALLGRGDSLYSGQGSSELVRVHGAFMSDDEVAHVAENWRARGKPQYLDEIIADTGESNSEGKGGSDDIDPLYDEVVDYVLSSGATSVSAVQRAKRIGYNRAARIIEQMEAEGILSAPNGNNKGREILVPTNN